ncbi:unnamed protein product [Ectocarpus fasciculatus]
MALLLFCRSDVVQGDENGIRCGGTLIPSLIVWLYTVFIYWELFVVLPVAPAPAPFPAQRASARLTVGACLGFGRVLSKSLFSGLVALIVKSEVPRKGEDKDSYSSAH